MMKSYCKEVKSFYNAFIYDYKSFLTAFNVAERNGFKKQEERDAVKVEIEKMERLSEFYKSKIDEWKYEDFHGKKVHHFEAAALRQIVEEINADLVGQPEQPIEVFSESELNYHIFARNGKLEHLSLKELHIRKIPSGIKKLINLKDLYIFQTAIRDTD